MNAKNKLDTLTQLIEEKINDQRGEKPGHIIASITKELGILPRDMSSVFHFLIESSPISYIKERQLMQAYKKIIESSRYSAEDAISCTSFGDQPAFIKAFKKQFKMTPTEAFFKKDPSLLLPPLSWDALSASERSFYTQKENTMAQTNTIFGVEQETYKKIMEASDLQALYGFTDAQSNAAFKLAERFSNCPADNILKEAFLFVDDFCMQNYQNPLGDPELPNEKELTDEILMNADLFCLCYNHNISIIEAVDMRWEFLSAGSEDEELCVDDMDPEVIQAYRNSSMPLKEFLECYRFYESHPKFDDFENFIQSAECWGRDTAYELGKELANPAFYDTPELDPHEFDFPEEETDFSRYERFDQEYDPDNPTDFYEDYEDSFF